MLNSLNDFMSLQTNVLQNKRNTLKKHSKNEPLTRTHWGVALDAYCEFFFSPPTPSLVNTKKDLSRVRAFVNILTFEEIDA